MKHCCRSVRGKFYAPLVREPVDVLQKYARASRCRRCLHDWDIAVHVRKLRRRSAVPRLVFVSVEQVHLAAERKEMSIVVGKRPLAHCAVVFPVDVPDIAAVCSKQMLRSARAADPYAANVCFFLRRCILSEQGGKRVIKGKYRFCSWTYLQVSVLRDAEVPHFGKLSRFQRGHAVRVFVQPEKRADF